MCALCSLLISDSVPSFSSQITDPPPPDVIVAPLPPLYTHATTTISISAPAVRYSGATQRQILKLLHVRVRACVRVRALV